MQGKNPADSVENCSLDETGLGSQSTWQRRCAVIMRGASRRGGAHSGEGAEDLVAAGRCRGAPAEAGILGNGNKVQGARMSWDP